MEMMEMTEMMEMMIGDDAGGDDRKTRWGVSREIGPRLASPGPCSGPQGGPEALRF